MFKLDFSTRSTFKHALIALAIPLLGCGGGGGEPGIEDDAGVEDDAAMVPDLGTGVVTLAGAGEPGSADGARDEARFNNPVNVAYGPDDTIYVADFDNGLLRRVTLDGEVSTVAVQEAGFSRPFGMAVGPDGALYVQTDYNAAGAEGGALWVLEPGSDIVELVLDNIGKTRGIAVLPDGRVIGANVTDHVILLIEPDTGAITEIAGSRGQASYMDGTGNEARFDTPYDLLVIEPNAVLVADRGNNRLRVVTVAGVVTTVAGTGEAIVRDGTIETAAFNGPQALAMDDAGMIYVSSAGGYAIQRMGDEVIEVIAGSGRPGFSDNEEDPTSAQFFGMEGITVSPAGGHLYVADGNRGEDGPYHRVRRISL